MPATQAGGGYRLPRHIDARLTAALRTLKNSDAAMRLAAFLARFHTAPGRLGRAFPVDRIALAAHAELQLTEARVRGALAALERIGFLVREAMPGSAYKRTAEGLHRKPVQWRFGPEFFPVFEQVNKRAQAARGAGSLARRAITPSTAQRPSAGVLVDPRAKLAVPASQLAKNQTQAGSVSLGEKKVSEPESPLEAALNRWRDALKGTAA